jgi:hypothetical protein
MDSITALTKALTKLYPSGKAFKLFANQWKNLNVALLEEPVRIKDFFVKVRDSGIPGRLPSEALEDWEELFQLQENSSLTDEERNQRIKARFDAVGGQGTDYLEDVLNDQFQFLLTYLVFDVRCGDGVSTCGNPSVVTCGSFVDESDRAEIVIHDCCDIDPADTNGILIIQGLDDNRDRLPEDSDYWGLIWYITGPDGLFSPMQLPANRETEFIEAVLKIKPVHTWVIAQITFV